MQTTIHIDSNHKVITSIKLLEELPVDGSHEVIIQEYSENRSMKQHRLYWKWVTEIANHMGIGKDEMHFAFKEKYAVPIYIRDDEGFATMVDAVKQVRRQGMNREADKIKHRIVELTSTTDFTVKQMMEMLNSIEQWAGEIGAEITFPEDLYHQAMGRK
jgi:hypothetical protein